MNKEIINFISEHSVMGEVWKSVVGFEERYMVSNYGRVISIDGRIKGYSILKPSVGFGGYLLTTLRKVDSCGKWHKRTVRIHTLVAEHFLIKPNIKRPVVNHKNGITTNNVVTNLEWTTHKENIRHAVRIGLFNTKGEKHKSSILTESDVKLARLMYYKGHRSHQQLADIFGISRRNMGDVINGVTWAWLKDGLKEHEQLKLSM